MVEQQTVEVLASTAVVEQQTAEVLASTAVVLLPTVVEYPDSDGPKPYNFTQNNYYARILTACVQVISVQNVMILIVRAAFSNSVQ